MKNNIKVTVVGLGYIGLPTAAVIASKNIKVFGYDVNEKVVSKVNKGEIHIIEPGLKSIVSNSVKKGFLSADIKVNKSDVYIIAVPTPFKLNNKPDTSYIENATTNIIPVLKNGDLFIIESTSPIGTTEKIMNLIFKERPDLVGNIFISYCPERVLPGNILHELVYSDRVIGGIDEKSTKKSITFYRNFVKAELHPTNARTAEMCKLAENSARDIQIAFANELSIICEEAKIDSNELIKLANKHPRVNILNPGCGVGGHCIAVDPYFIISDFPKNSNLIQTARKVNNNKSEWCLNQIIKSKDEFEIENNKKPKIAVLGLSYKANIDDLRESPAEYIAKKLAKIISPSNLFVCEPNIERHDAFTIKKYHEAVKICDIIVLLVPHNEFINIEYIKNKKYLDFCGILKNKI